MSDDSNTQGMPPESPASPPGAPGAPGTPATPATKPSANVSPALLIWLGIAVVLLSFLAAFLGSWLANSNEPTAAEATPAPTISEDDRAAYEEAIEEILPAGASVRAGTGVPESGNGYEGGVYIDISTSDVYVFLDDDWTLVGNIRAEAAENLTGATGAAGATGATGDTGATGETGAAGAPGTQLNLGVGEPQNDTCTADGDVYIDTETVAFYECSNGEWTLFGPTDESAPTPEMPTVDPSEEPSEG